MALKRAEGGSKILPLGDGLKGKTLKGYFIRTHDAPPESDYPDSKSISIRLTEGGEFPVYVKGQKTPNVEALEVGAVVKIDRPGHLRYQMEELAVEPGMYIEVTYEGRDNKKFKGKYPHRFDLACDVERRATTLTAVTNEQGDADSTASKIEALKSKKAIA